MKTIKNTGVLLLTLACSACVTNRDVRQWLIWEKTQQVTEVRRSQQCATPGNEPSVLVLANLAEVRQWEAQRGINLTGAPGAALAADLPYAVIEMGQRATAGYGFAISRQAGRRKEVLTLKATFIEPAPDSMQAQMITSPCAMVSLPPRTYLQVEVIDQDGELRAISRR